MARKTYKEQLQKLMIMQQKVEEARKNLACQIGCYILDNNQDITSIKDFKEIWNAKHNNQTNDNY